ncbi:Ku protein [Streptomyces sp. NPDC047117]|uniref:non-homologous end joining protein Ku n=1 Tax=Streptomyces sp. NPDC047117 TaxID=3155379 RepID=UPI0033E9C785
MAHAVWSGALSFGLVALPVQLVTATESHTVHFHQLERGTSDRVRNKRVNERTGKEVRYDDIVKGWDAGDEYVLVEPDELDEIAPGRSKSLEISGFVDLDAVEPIYFDKTYYLAPKSKEYAKVYGLLREALAKANKAGIATFVMRNREYLVAVKAEDDILALHTLHWADEVRDPHEELPTLPGRAAPDKKELDTAVALVDALTVEWDPSEYRDTYQEKVRRLIEAKRTGESVEKAEPAPEPTNVIDLREALQASVDRAKDRRKSGGKAKSDGKQGSGPDLDGLTKAELYRRATDAGVPGRSSMSRDELIEALSGSGSKNRRRKKAS